MLEHGGRLRAVACQSDIPLGNWLDLSTGINPHPYPVPQIPSESWQRLPEDNDGLEAAATAYYDSRELLPVAGSQAAIQMLPAVLPGRRITLLTPSYGEHKHAWRERETHLCGVDEIEAVLPQTDVLVIVNPNNPSGNLFSREKLLSLHERLAAKGGWLVVDEAFIDTDPRESLTSLGGRENLVILRSMGKFFGLAGARVGFVFAPMRVRMELAQRLGPWAVAGPSRYAAARALQDRQWQQQNRNALLAAGQRLQSLLQQSGFDEPAGTPLFQWVITPHAEALYRYCLQRGILIRKFDQPASLRFGLPADESGWARLRDALAGFSSDRSAPA